MIYRLRPELKRSELNWLRRWLNDRGYGPSWQAWHDNPGPIRRWAAARAVKKVKGRSTRLCLACSECPTRRPRHDR